MATHIQLFPEAENYHLGDNEAYMYLIDSYLLDKQDSWNFNNLVYEYGSIAAHELLESKVVLKQREDNIKLAFIIPSTISNMILKLIEAEPSSSRELLQKLPKHLKLSAQDLKNQFSYLLNFHKIQLFTMPGSAITFVVSDDDHLSEHAIERSLDNVYVFSDRIESKYAYIQDSEETAKEFWDLTE